MTTLKREPLQIVELDIDYCSRTYGSAPCTATLTGTPTGVRKCYNTFATCQDTANFNAGTLTLRFARSQMGLPKGTIIYPALRSVSTNPTKISLGGVGDRIGSLGKRARVTIALEDFTDSDIYTDKYRAGRIDGTAQTDEGGYNPQDRGTFFGKLTRRFPYYYGRSIRVLEGYVGDALASMRTRHYVVTEWSGPDASGRVTITAADVLDLADNNKAKCPTPNSGKLGAAISAGYLSTVTLTPSGVGSEYSTSGYASIGSEIVGFTRASDTITLTERGAFGSEASAHSIDDLFQEAYVADDATIDDLVYDLLVNYAGISSSFINTTDWADEAERWLSGYNMNACIAKPTGVAELIGEVAQLGVIFYWDDVDQEIVLRANRPNDLSETPADLTDDNAIVEKSLARKDLHENRLTRVLFWHGVLDYTDNATGGENFAKAFVAVDSSAEGADEYDQQRTHQIFCRFLGQGGDDTVAATVAQRLLNRFRDTPKEVTFTIDVKDESDTRLGQIIDLTTRMLQDDTGKSIATPMQVTAVEEVRPSHSLRITAQTFTFAGRYGFITENSRSDYAASSAAEIEQGIYIVGASGTFGDGTGPYLMF
jgi:hypothetical protein